MNLLVKWNLKVAESHADCSDRIFHELQVLLTELILKKNHHDFKNDFQPLVFHFLLRSTQFSQLLADQPELFILISQFGHCSSLLNPLFPLSVFEFLGLSLWLSNIFWSRPKSPVIFFSLISQRVTFLHLFLVQVLVSLLWKLCISISNGRFPDVGTVSNSNDISEEVGLLLIVLRTSNCQLNKLSLYGFSEIRLRTLPHLPGVGISNSDKLQLWKVKGNAAEIFQTDQLQLQTLDSSHEAPNRLCRAYLAPHVYFLFRLPI